MKDVIMERIIGSNLKKFRIANRYTEQQVASFLGINRSTYSNYELGMRQMPFEHLCKTAELFGCELDTLISEDENVVNEMLACAFRVDDLSTADLEQIARFKKMVMNYLKISRLIAE